MTIATSTFRSWFELASGELKGRSDVLAGLRRLFEAVPFSEHDLHTATALVDALADVSGRG